MRETKIFCERSAVSCFLVYFVLIVFGGVLFVSPAHSQTTEERTFVNKNPIVINDDSTASQYPSDLFASWDNVASVKDIEVRLFGLTHTFPDDIDIILVSPTGQRSVLMSDSGGGNGVTNLTLTFEDGAAVMPNDGVLTSIAYDPANYIGNDGENDTFPAPGPGSITQNADLNVFDGSNPTGFWSLYVVDDQGGDSGEIANGWELKIEVEVATVTKTADTDDGVCDADCSLREAIAVNPNLIRFSSFFNTPQTISLDSQLAINDNIAIEGPGARLLTITPAKIDTRIFDVSDTSQIYLSGMTLSGADALGLFGGAILNNGFAFLENMMIKANTSDHGGGIFNAGTLELINSTVSENDALLTEVELPTMEP